MAASASDLWTDEERGESYLLDPELALAAARGGLRGARADLSEVIRRLRAQGVPLSEVARHVLRRPSPKASTWELFARGGDGRALVPGSTLKGAMRTALLGGMVWRGAAGARDHDADRQIEASTRRPARDPARAAARVEEALLRGGERDLRADLLRALRVSDTAFPASTLTLCEIRTSSPSARDTRRTKPGVRGLEVLPPGAAAQVGLSLDSFLTGGFMGRVPKRARAVAAGAGGPRERRIEQAGADLAKMAETAMSWAREHISRERHHLERLGLKAEVAALDNVAHAAKSAPEGSWLLRLGSGIGWSAVTGGWLTDPERLALLSAYGPLLGLRPGAYASADAAAPFPKSRKIVSRCWSRGDHRGATLGWALLEPGRLEESAGVEPLKAPEAQTAAAAAAALPSELEEVLGRLRALPRHRFIGTFPAIMSEARNRLKSEEDRASFATEVLAFVAADRSILRSARKRPWFTELQQWAPPEEG